MVPRAERAQLGCTALLSSAADLVRVGAGHLTPLFGSFQVFRAAEPALNSRFKLVGLVAARVSQPQTGLALIAVDGKPPRPIGLGGVVDGSLVLLAVNHRRVELGPSGGNATVTLELPLVPEPNRAVRPNTPVPLVNAAPPVAAPGVRAPIAPSAPPPLPPVPGVNRNSPETR